MPILSPRLLGAGFMAFLPFLIFAQASPDAKLAIEQFSVSFQGGRVISLVLVKNISNFDQELTGRLSVEKPGTEEKTGGTIVVSKPQQIWVEEERNFQVLKPGEEKRFEFDFFLSSHLPPATYTFVFEVLSPLGQAWGGLSTRLSLEGDGKFLGVSQENCRVLKKIGNKEFSFHPQEAGWFEAEESPQVRCEVRNLSSSSLRAKMFFLTNEFAAFGYYLASPEPSFGETYTFSPGERKTILFSLPQKTRAQVYEAAVQFVDPQNPAERLSALLPLRWTVRGAGARLISWSLDKRTSYGLGERLEFTVNYYGSPDVFWDDELLPPELRIQGSELDEARILAEVHDGKGDLCGKSEKALPKIKSLELQSERLAVNLKRCENPKISVKIADSDNVLSAASLNVPAAGEKARAWVWVAAALILLLVLILIVIKVIKKRTYAGIK